MRLATLFNVLLTGISVHTGLLIGANISGIGQSTGLFFLQLHDGDGFVCVCHLTIGCDQLRRTSKLRKR